MVSRKNSKNRTNNQRCGEVRKPRITAETPHKTCRDRLTAFGGLLALVKFLDLVEFKEAFQRYYIKPVRRTKLGCYRMVVGILMLLFIGFQRLGHFKYLRDDSMMCGFLNVHCLPVVSTFWRYLRSVGLVQSQSLIRLNAAVRRKVWSLCRYAPQSVTIEIDTTVSTIYGKIEGARKGHNTKHRGKKGLRPVLCFIHETREYLCGTQRRGETITCREVSYQIRQFWRLLPESVRNVLILADGEMMGWTVVKACEDEEFSYILANRRCSPPFQATTWYRHDEYEYNECFYQPHGWLEPRRFVVMRIRRDQLGDRQLKLFEIDQYAYRVFVTNLNEAPHTVIARYDQRAEVENLIKEAQHEGILAVPSKNFHANHTFFQIVMLAYNIWRWIRMLAACQAKETKNDAEQFQPEDWPDSTVRLIRLKSLFVAAKIRFHGNRNEVLYSIHESRTEGLVAFLDYLDRKRKEVKNVA